MASSVQHVSLDLFLTLLKYNRASDNEQEVFAL